MWAAVLGHAVRELGKLLCMLLCWYALQIVLSVQVEWVQGCHQGLSNKDCKQSWGSCCVCCCLGICSNTIMLLRQGGCGGVVRGTVKRKSPGRAAVCAAVLNDAAETGIFAMLTRQRLESCHVHMWLLF